MSMPAACSSPTRPFTVRWPAVPPAAVGRSACAKVVTVTRAVIAGAAATTDPSSGSPDNASAPATANAATGSSARRWLRPSVGRWRSRSPQTCPVQWSPVRCWCRSDTTRTPFRPGRSTTPTPNQFAGLCARTVIVDHAVSLLMAYSYPYWVDCGYALCSSRCTVAGVIQGMAPSGVDVFDGLPPGAVARPAAGHPSGRTS